MAPQPAAKGYKPDRRKFRLDFSDTAHAGLEVFTRGASIGELLHLMEIADELSGLMEGGDELTMQDAGKMAESLRGLFSPFARKLISWNLLDDDDEPVPATVDGLLSEDLEFSMFLLTKYIEAMTQAPPPLPGTSPSGTSSPGALAQMAALSSSLPSS